MNKILAAALFSTVFIASAFAEESPSMADIMHSSPDMMAPGSMHGHDPAGAKGDCDSAEHAMGGRAMMGNEDDCDSMHGKDDSHMMGMNEDDCDTAHSSDDRHGYGMGDYAGMGRMGGHDGFGRGGRGYGMMGGPGAGMMGGPGAGMMGGPGAGMMMEPNMRMFEALALSDEQQEKISMLADKLKHDNWATQGLINDETAKLRDLYEADKRDPAVIGKEYQKIFDLKRKMIETYLESQNRIEAVLTPEQRSQMKSARRTMRGMYGRHMQ